MGAHGLEALKLGLGPSYFRLQGELEKLQKHATRFVTRNYYYETGSMTYILGILKEEEKGLLLYIYIYTNA